MNTNDTTVVEPYARTAVAYAFRKHGMPDGRPWDFYGLNPGEDSGSIENLGRVQIETVGRAHIGRYGDQAGYPQDRDLLCVLVDEGGQFFRGYRAYDLDEALELGYARIAAK